MPQTIQYDATGVGEGETFAAAYSVVDADTGEVFCKVDVVGRGEGPESVAETKAITLANLLNAHAARTRGVA